MFKSLKYLLLSYGNKKYSSCRFLLILILTSALTPEKTDRNENALWCIANSFYKSCFSDCL